MPAEKFYDSTTSDPEDAHLVVSWGEKPSPQVTINGVEYERSGLNRLIRSLTRARNQVYGADEPTFAQGLSEFHVELQASQMSPGLVEDLVRIYCRSAASIFER